ncbi:hypothetical protein ASPTUDRAFT_41054 [Aspergillus tubingensis CBS 134.48]|uniref:Uncharacterized protein n=1 Tax=Aspergillus tubingensis (strain CBS 134.48) TaxID=767770 RepID=A0A1L9N737_ASPTC|nr:hypothetical protein ASPTUDRAFT_41054 [Aspergillus tubingensis CBS 134.48]
MRAEAGPRRQPSSSLAALVFSYQLLRLLITGILYMRGKKRIIIRRFGENCKLDWTDTFSFAAGQLE